MSKKISKKASIVRTISLAVISLSLVVMAVSEVTKEDNCISNYISIVNETTPS